MNKFTSSSFFIFILVLILIGVITATTKEGYRRYQTTKKIINLEKEVKLLEEKNKSLFELLDYSNSEKFLEKEARIELNFLKKGEKLVVIKGKDNLENQNFEENQQSKKQFSNFQKWQEYFFK